MHINILSIPNREMRYRTCGDWWVDPDGTIQIRVSELSTWQKEALVAVHELWEGLVCKHRGITQDAVDAFDMEFEANRGVEDESEPGDQPDAPYRREHCSATGVERILASELDVPWKDYEEEILSLP
jgi:hypothetical protein